MSTSPGPFTSQAEYLQYRSLSVSAVAAFALAILGLPAVLFPSLLVIPAIGIALGLFSVDAIAASPGRVDRSLARLEWVADVGQCPGSRCRPGAATAMRRKYRRAICGFPTSRCSRIPRIPELPIPPSALELNGQRVFVKGYVHPGVDRRRGIRQFVLVPDMKTCCFGGQPALTDMIEVTLRDPLRVDFSYTRRKLGGILKVSPRKKSVAGLDGVFYELDADYVR